MASWREGIRITLVLGLTFHIVIAIHAIEAWAWAAVYYLLDEFTSFESALYFSVVTSTTLGYGDITLSERWRILGSFEAMGGLILFGVSTAFLFMMIRDLLEPIVGAGRSGGPGTQRLARTLPDGEWLTIEVWREGQRETIEFVRAPDDEKPEQG